MIPDDTDLPPVIETTKTTKSELIAALKEALAYCDRAYDSLTDVTAAQMVKLGPNEIQSSGRSSPRKT